MAIHGKKLVLLNPNFVLRGTGTNSAFIYISYLVQIKFVSIRMGKKGIATAYLPDSVFISHLYSHSFDDIP